MDRALVSVVIPTIGRPELARAIESVLQQSVSAEVVVVADLPEGGLPPELQSVVSQQGITIVHTGGGVGGSGARNIGVSHASGKWIAFLDDDDEWMPDRLEHQLALADAESNNPEGLIVASRHIQCDSVTGRQDARPVPARVISPSENVGEYLFRNRRPSLGRASIYTSTLLIERTVADAIPWDESLGRHQDWDWLVRAEARGARFLQAERPLVKVWTNSVGSISSTTDWRASLAWARTLERYVERRTVADFVAAQCLRYALSDGSPAGVLSCIGRWLDLRRPPRIRPLLIGLAGAVPRKALSRVLMRGRAVTPDAGADGR